MATDKKYYTVSSLAKAFGVIEMMARETRWELGKLAEACGMPKGTLQRILLTLTELGYVTRERGQYALSLKLVRLGRDVADKNNMLTVIQPYCRKLVTAVNETVNLCMLNGTRLVVMHQETSTHALRLDSAVGTSFSVFPSASGKVFCAFMSELDYLRLMQDIRRENPGLAQSEVDRFSDSLKLVRRDGVAFDFEEVFTGVRCVSAPVFNYTGEIAAALSCSVPVMRINADTARHLVDAISQTARDISKALGAKEHRFSTPDGAVLVNTPARA